MIYKIKVLLDYITYRKWMFLSTKKIVQRVKNQLEWMTYGKRN